MFFGCHECGGPGISTPCDQMKCAGAVPVPITIGPPSKPPSECSFPLAIDAVSGKLYFFDHLAATPKWECAAICA